MEEAAPAKINLALHVRERRTDGYHRIETIFAFAEEGDRLRVDTGEGVDCIDTFRIGAGPQAPSPQGGEDVPPGSSPGRTLAAAHGEGERAQRASDVGDYSPPPNPLTQPSPPRGEGSRADAEDRDGLSLIVEGPFAAMLAGEGDNLVLRAARGLAERYGVGKGARLVLDKRLPVASGIGGGSADAAAALRLLTRFWRLDAAEDDLLAIARTLGADVPACLLSRTMRGDGRGDALVPWDGSGLAGAPLLLVNPGVAVSTAEIFARWDGVDRGPLPDDLAQGRNDLEPPAIALAPVIAEALEALRTRSGALLARMSGSGATCFALFASEAARDAAAAAIRRAHPGWWQLASRLRG